MSANLVVDIANTCDYRASINVGSGSNLVVGEIVDLMQANTYCNIFCAGGAGSGAIQLQIQTSDSTTSGSFTDPTSGLSQMPVNVVSGGQVFVNSGLWVSGNYSVTAPVNNAPVFCSGGIQFAAFQRPQQYARLISVSGPFPTWFTAGFVSNKKVTGSGGGYSWQPLAGGTVNV